MIKFWTVIFFIAFFVTKIAHLYYTFTFIHIIKIIIFESDIKQICVVTYLYI